MDGTKHYSGEICGSKDEIEQIKQNIEEENRWTEQDIICP